MHVCVRGIQDGDTDRVAEHMRAMDARECWAAMHWSPKKSLMESILASSKVWVGAVDGNAVVIAGVGPVNLLAGKGAPWLLATVELEESAKLKRLFLKYAKEVLPEMLELYPVLENATLSEHLQSRRLLRWLGFSFSPPVRAGLDNALWTPFSLEKKDVLAGDRRGSVSGRDAHVGVCPGSGGAVSGPGRSDECADRGAESAGRDRPRGGRRAETANANGAASRHTDGGPGG